MEELKRLLKELGYSTEDYSKITNGYAKTRYKTETLTEKIKECFDFFYTLGYTKEEILKMTKRVPIIFSLSIKNMQQKIEDMQKLGYTQEDVINIVKRGPAILTYNIENIKQKIEDMKELGYTQKDVIKMIKILPSICSLSIYNIKQKIGDMQELGYRPEEIINMAKRSPIIYALTIDSIKQKIEDIMKLGYTKNDVIKMTKNIPMMYSLGIDNINQKLSDMQELGYTQEEVIRMTKKLPAIFCYSVETLKQKMEYVKKYGYTEKEVMEMIKIVPTILGYSTERTSGILEFFDSINLHQLVVNDPYVFRQSPELSYARHQFLKIKGIEVDYTNYRILSKGKKQFEKEYGITTKELLEMFPYEERTNNEPDEEKTKKIKARIEELEKLNHKNNAVENLQEKLESLIKLNIDTSKIKNTDTIKSLIKRQHVKVDLAKLEEEGLELDYPIGDRLSNVKLAYREGSNSARATEEQAKIFMERYGILLERQNMTQKFMAKLEVLYSCGVDTSKITDSDTVQSLIEKTSTEVDLDEIKKSVDLNEKIGKTYENVKRTHRGKTKGIPPEEDEVRIILEKYGISLDEKDYFEEFISLLETIQSCGVETSYLKTGDTIEKLIEKSIKKSKRQVDIEKVEERIDLKTNIGYRLFKLIHANEEKGKIKPLTEEQKKILLERYGIQSEKRNIKSKAPSKKKYSKKTVETTEVVSIKEKTVLEEIEQKTITSQENPTACQINIEGLSDEELDKFIKEMDERQKENEQKIERLKKIKRANELIALSKQQNREIAELKSQIKNKEIKFYG